MDTYRWSDYWRDSSHLDTDVRQAFSTQPEDLETLTTELGILVAMKDSGHSFDGSGELAKLIEDRLANYLKRDHPGAIRT
ncbi:MAG: hypothetical protein ACRDO2_03855 [Nocardioidaceae bacterium]